MRKLALSFLILSTYSQANTLPNTANFYDENLQTHSEGTSFDVKQNGGSEYLIYHNILDVLKLNPYIYNPDFQIGVMDSGIYPNHEDFHNFYQGYLGGDQTIVPNDIHGNMVSSLFGHSQVADKKGTHGVINAKVNFINQGSYNDAQTYREFLNNFQKKPRVVNISYTQHYCSSYRPYAEAKKGNYYCGLDKDSKYDSSVTSSHIRNFQDIRTEVLKHPDTLFVIAAGNRGVDALWEEGAIHYEVDEQGSLSLTPRKVDNVLIVGDIHNNGELKDYSNYGETIDIAAIGTTYAASTTSTDSTGNVKSFYDKYSGTSFSAPIVSGMASILFSMDPSLTPKEVKDLLTNSNKSTTTRRTGNLIFDKTEQTSLIPIADLSVSYHTLISRLKSHAILDSLKFNNKGENISNTNDCTIFWQQNNAERSVIGPKKVYESLFYGNKCLYFRGNSFIIEYDIETEIAGYLYYGNAHYDEYQTVRKFINNMKSARTDETWRQGYGVGLNTQGNVACLSADGSACTQPLNTTQQCEDIWEALTGVLPNAVNKVASNSENGVCKYANPTEENVIVYDSNKGETKRYAGTDYYSIFPEELDDNKLYSIMELNNSLFSNDIDAFPYKCEIFLNKVFPEGVPKNIISHVGAGTPCFYTVSKDFFIRIASIIQQNHYPTSGYLAICNDRLYKKLNSLFPNPNVNDSHDFHDLYFLYNFQELDNLWKLDYLDSSLDFHSLRGTDILLHVAKTQVELEDDGLCLDEILYRRSILNRYRIKDGIWYNKGSYYFK